MILYYRFNPLFMELLELIFYSLRIENKKNRSYSDHERYTINANHNSFFLL